MKNRKKNTMRGKTRPENIYLYLCYDVGKAIFQFIITCFLFSCRTNFNLFFRIWSFFLLFLSLSLSLFLSFFFIIVIIITTSAYVHRSWFSISFWNVQKTNPYLFIFSLPSKLTLGRVIKETNLITTHMDEMLLFCFCRFLFLFCFLSFLFEGVN